MAKQSSVKVAVDDDNKVVSIIKDSAFTAYRVSRTNANAVITSKKSSYREAFSRYGVYLLIEDDTKTPLKFYVGKASNIIKRFGRYTGNKPERDWTDAIILVCNDKAFPWGEDEIAWFEYWLLQGMKDAGRYQYANDPNQTKEGSVDEDRCRHQLKDMQFCISLLGYPKLFDADKPKATPSTTPVPTTGNKKADSAAYQSFPYSAAGAACAMMLELLKTNSLTAKDIDYLTSSDATKFFRLQGNKFLRKYTGTKSDFFKHPKDPKVRFRADPILKFGKDKYLISTQFFPASFDPLLVWGSKWGFTLPKVVALCKKYDMKER